MQPVLGIEDVRGVEQALADEGVSLAELMRRAGTAAAREVMRLGDVEVVTVFAGGGNNGGDGWVAAEALLRRGVDVRVVTAAAPADIKSDLARDAAEHAEKEGVEYLLEPTRDEIEELLDDTDVILDAVFGTGFDGAPRAPYNLWIDCMNATGASVLAVDVPSGLSAQTGHAEGACVIADVTVTMLALKPGLLSDEGRDVCGSIVVAPLDKQVDRLAEEAEPLAYRLDLADYVSVITPPSLAIDKFTRGSVLVVGGSLRYPGAPMMAALAAARAGAGYVTLAVPASVAPVVQAHMMEIPVVSLPELPDGSLSPTAVELVGRLAETRSAVLVGPGMGICRGTAEVVTRLLRTDVPLVIDADGLNTLARLTAGGIDEQPEILRREAPLVLTPHRGELGRLVGMEEPPDSLVAMVEAARGIVWANGGSNFVVIAKGPASACVGVEAAVLPKPGPAALATAGSGDVLGGITASLLAQSHVDGPDLPLLAAYACETHGLAGYLAAERYGTRGVMAGDVINEIGIAQDALVEQITAPSELDEE